MPSSLLSAAALRAMRIAGVASRVSSNRQFCISAIGSNSAVSASSPLSGLPAAAPSFHGSSGHCSLFGCRCFVTGDSHQIASQKRSFSSGTAADSLRETIQKELAHEQSNFEVDQSLSAFVRENGWKLEEKENDMIVTLTKTVGGKRVAVEFSCIQPSGGEEEALLEACDFTVTVHESADADGAGVIFYCSTTSEEEQARFCIGQVRIFSDAASREAVSGYPGPYFEDLDDAFQEALDKWLGSMGIDEKLCDFVERFAAQKENGEYIKWLQKLGGLVGGKH